MANLSNQTSEVAVKVAVRVRPLNSREKLHQHQPCVRLSSETNQLVIGKDKIFTFDYVLAPKTSQSDLYESCVHQLVESIFDGYNSTVFAYGQTGSGKTHTISGSNQDYGIIPRAVEAMFEIINSKQNQRDYLVKVNFIEIYKEELKDLLDSSEKDLHIREDESGNTIIYGANEVVCSSLEEVMACFDSGTLLRHTGSTQMNEQSSRSHSVFTVSIEQRWTNDAKVNVRESAIYELRQQANNDQNSYYLGAKFHFVDLAGSERVHRTGNVGDRFKESIHINSGLLALGNVISALSSDNATKKKIVHIPYRESKITRILKDSLGGNSNTLMICCISPSSCNLDESINALKYASRARYIKNKPIVNMDPEQQKFVEMQSEIQALREELSRQRTFISEANLATNNDEDMIIIQDKLEQAQNERDMYKKLSKEAFNRFKQFDQFLNQNNLNMIKKLTDEWLHIFESSKDRSDFDVDDFSKQRITHLEQQLKQAQDDLKSDEEIFSDKENEINHLKELISDLEQKLQFSNRCLEQSLNKEREQQELLLQLQLQLDNLIAQKQDSDSQNTSGYKSLNISNKSLNKLVNQRAKTAPVEESINKKINVRPGAYSTPAISNGNLDRFMQNFRARSQLLTETLEENDCVLQNSNLNGKFNSTFSVDDDEQVDDHDLNQDNDQECNKEFNFVRNGTFKIDKNKQMLINDKGTANNKNSNNTNNTTNNNNNNNNNNKIRDMSINIKMKEELIKELVANSKITNRLNVQLKQKIELMEREINQYKTEIVDLQRQAQTIGNLSSAKASDLDLKKKLEHAQNRIMELEANRNKANLEKKLSDMEIAFGKLKQQNDLLQKRIKDDTDKKLRLEKDYEKEQQRLKELETKSEKQQQILKKKTEDLAQAQRRLRSASQSSAAPADTEQKHWVEQEMEKILHEKRQVELFKEELIKREELIKKKECLIKEKDRLEDKKSKNLQESHLSLIKQRKYLDEKLNNGTELTAQEERRLIEIDEAIEAIEIAIEYENDSIREKQIKLKDSVYFDNTNQINENVLDKFSNLSSEESRILLKKFFVKIIDLKEQELKLKLDNNELEIQIEEQAKVVEQLKLALKQSVSASTDAKSLDLKYKNEKIIKMLQQQLNDSKSREVLLEREIELYKEKILKLKQKYQNQNLESESLMSILNSHIDNSNTVLNGDLKSSFKSVKMSRKDLRPLTQEELIKRSLNRQHQQLQQSNVNSINENV